MMIFKLINKSTGMVDKEMVYILNKLPTICASSGGPGKLDYITLMEKKH